MFWIFRCLQGGTIGLYRHDLLFEFLLWQKDIDIVTARFAHFLSIGTWNDHDIFSDALLR